MHQFIMDNFDDSLSWREALGHFFADGLLTNAGDKFLDDFEIDIGFKQRQTHFTQARINIGLAESSFTAQAIKYVTQAVR